MSTALFDRGTEEQMNLTPITDGLVYFCTSNNRIYMDNGNTRLQYGGDTTIIQDVYDASETNVFSASASTNLFLQKTNLCKPSAVGVWHVPMVLSQNLTL